MVPKDENARRSAAGPLVVSEANPRYFTVAIRQRRRPAGGLPDRLAHLEQLPRRHGSRLRLRRDPGAVRLRRLPRVSQGPRPQLHPALALGAVQVPGRRGQLPPLHDAAAVAANRARNGQGRQAEVRPRGVRPGLLRPAARPRHRRGQRGHLRRGDALRRLGPPPQPARPTTSRAIRSTPRTTSTGSASPRSSTTRSSRSTRASRRSRRRTSARSSTPSTTCPTFSTRSRTNRRAAGRSTETFAEALGLSATAPSGATPPSGSTG